MTRTTLAIAALLLASPVRAQTTDSLRWAPWIGCWGLAGEAARDGSSSGLVTEGTRTPLPTTNARPRICIESPDGHAATFSTRIREQVVHELTVTPDASEHPLVDGACRGTQHAEWSPAGRHLLSGATLTCTGDGSVRTVSGIGLLLTDGSWLDVQSVSVGERASVRVRRYRRTGETAPAAAASLGAPFTRDDIQYASPRVSALALEAALVEGDLAFIVSKKDLVGFATAGVPASVVDVVVALSYPERFVVEREPSPAMAGGAFQDPYWLGWAFGYPAWFDSSSYYARPYGALFPYDYGPYAYGTLGVYDSRLFVPGGVIGGGVGGGARAPSSRPEPSGNGRAVNGRGYTRIRPREAGDDGTDAPATSDRVGSAGRRVGPSTPSSGGTSSGTGGSSGAGGGASGRPTGRTAQPR